jgi:O-acetyl-ADP-ribose deacetylase (regulator of RNase III)
MGRGLALDFKQRYPAMFAVYQQECKTGKLRIGRPTLYRDSTPWILNFPTKDHWRFPSRLDYLEKGLEFLVANYQKSGIKSIAFPKLGTQNGKLSWDEVGPLMVRYLCQLDAEVYIYIADGDLEYQAQAMVSTSEQHDIPSDNNTALTLSSTRSVHEIHSASQETGKVTKDKRVSKTKKPASKKSSSSVPQFTQATFLEMMSANNSQ